MNEICERALECYIKNLEKDNKTLRDFAKRVWEIAHDQMRDDEYIVKDIISLAHMYKDYIEEE